MSDDVVTPEDFQAILAQLRDWVRTKVVPREREIADADAVPDDLRKQAADMGLFGYAIPQEWGGLGLDLTQDVELAMELGYTSLAVRSMFGTNNGIAGQVLVNFGTDEQKAAWLERLASGAVVASFALTEPGAGSNPAGLQTRAVRDGDDWVIDGQKRFITNAPSADLFVVFARTRPADESGTGIAVFLLPAETAGVEVGAKDRKMGQEGAWTSDVHFSDVRVPASALVGGDVDAGYRAAMTSLARGRVHIAALAVGSAQRALDESVAYAASATQGGTVIGEFQLVQAMLADQQTGVLAGRALVRETAARYVSGEDRRIGPSAAKLFCTEMAGQVADLAVQIHGGSGYMRDVPVERIYRDVRLLRLYEGTSEIQRLIIGGGLIRAARRLAAGRGQERHDRIGNGLWCSPGQVMTRALDELQARVGQSACQSAGGFEGNHGVFGVGEHQHRRRDRRDSVLQLAQLVQQSALLGQEGAPLRVVSAVRTAPDLPVGMLVRTQRAALPPGDPGQPGPCHPRRQPPRHQRAQLACAGCGEQPVPAGQAPRADAGEQDYRLYPAGRQARRRQRHPAAVGVPHEHRAGDAARVQVVEDDAGVRGEPARGKLAGAVARPVSCHGVKLGGQQPGDLLPVGRRAGLPVQQHHLVRIQRGGRARLGDGAVPRRSRAAPGTGTPQPEHDQPSSQYDQPETGQAVEQHRRQCPTGT
jgi:acyl-CoA dehydrogenase